MPTHPTGRSIPSTAFNGVSPIVRSRSRGKTLHIEGQFVVIREATEVVLRHLECLPSCDSTEQVRARVQDCMQEAEMWSASWPTQRELDVLMKRLLALHVEVTRLEHYAGLAMGKPAIA
jgi:hypothetical protein